VRELQKVVTEAVAVAEGGPCLRLSHLPESVAAVMESSPRPVLGASSAGNKRPSPTRGELEELMQKHDGNVAQVARVLDRQWAVVWRWIVKHQIDPVRYRSK
jgi:transcriptional regulator of acetoin/glycerol metabolism